jgi:hypothetical protein
MGEGTGRAAADAADAAVAIRGLCAGRRRTIRWRDKSLFAWPRRKRVASG